ncbi:MAG: hypothetical protein ACMUIA_02015 [bacterium]
MFIVLTGVILILNPRMAKASRVENQCLACHKGLPAHLALYPQEWTTSIHAARNISCENCHGGDPTSSNKPDIGQKGYRGAPAKHEIPAFCDRCHADPLYMRTYNVRIDEENVYKNSIHGQRLLKEGNTYVASCVDCHGSHDIKEVDDPRSRVNHLNIAETCARCHACDKLMKPFGIPTDQIIQYKKSYHGKILYKQIEHKNPRLVPSCPGCHGIHGDKPTGVRRYADACYNCHFMAKRYFNKSIHSILLKESRGPHCIHCHGYHYIPEADEDLFIGREASHCGDCHAPESKEYQNGLDIRALLLQAKTTVEREQDNISQVRKDLDIDISDLELNMKDALQNLLEAERATHSQDVLLVREITQKVHKDLSIIDEQIHDHYQEARQRKLWLLEMLLLISCLFSFIAYQRARLKRK